MKTRIHMSASRLIYWSCLCLLLMNYGCIEKHSTSETTSTTILNNSNVDSTGNQADADSSRFGNFILTYSWAGFGSNMGILAPMFVVKGTHFKYTYEQNSYVGKQTKSPEKIAQGELSESTIESIINLVKPIEDSLVYKTNVEVMSGGVYYIHVVFNEIDITFNLYNASDPTAKKIVALLNPYILDERYKLSMWKD